MAKQPAFQFYPKDWLVDTNSLSLAAKGAWIDLLCKMWYSPTRGILMDSMTGYGRMIGSSVEQAEKVITELILKGICDAEIEGVNVTCNGNVTLRNKNVTLISRRMARDDKERYAIKLRVKAHRERKGCNAKVTVPSPSPSPLNTPLPPFPKGELCVPDFHSPEYQKLNSQAVTVLEHLNGKCGLHYQPLPVNLRRIIERLHDGYPVDTLTAVIDTQNADPEFKREWLSPKTLFEEEKFQTYLQRVGTQEQSISPEEIEHIRRLSMV